ncbi:hypothetical protein FOXG_08836 [Fusarium oxysporum f. sp. lycopersici 4287]|uniref:Uncharacterized protein n=2 Tax=Fusarium oxysporum TaxID=5507 RepID=A0A0J9V9I2_FUSO4|nr:hypothetical protein FOXG_08836 [Fusarium oxysporum f. sp. lycopersici 4287]EXK27798.1 hypothetical protein FOMG_15646 [Fusarium oxysporum f. sp. melonis 26406]KAJ9424321.1 hypothetical protein QL093DRAFT_2098279 [Fusarium oxysporum]KNB07760.1 hypothetical protein FOXG_08836 [Fusarium oxysporum f. sp. lycopersici 4287]
MLVFQDQKLESLKGVRGLLVPVSTNTPTRRPLAGGISGQPELDTLVASWNKVVARRFCQMHKGYFENGDWATTENRNQSDGVSNSTSDNQRKRPRLDSGISSDVSPRIGSREEAIRPQPRQLSPLRRPPVSRTPGRPSSPPTQERQSRPAGSFPRGHDSQYPDKWVGDGEPHRPCQPRGFREDTVEFDNMSTRRQNQLIRTQNRTLLEKLEELGPRSERRPRNNHDSYHRPLTRRFRSNWYFESDKMRVTAISRSPDLVKKEQQPMGDFLDPDFGLGGGDNLYSTSVAR